MKRDYQFWVYILTSPNHGVLYVGMTENIMRRIQEHKNKVSPNSFTARYNVCELMYYESYQYVYDAIAREKQLKGGSRQQKIDLINSINPDWIDLSLEWEQP